MLFGNVGATYLKHVRDHLNRLRRQIDGFFWVVCVRRLHHLQRLKGWLQGVCEHVFIQFTVHAAFLILGHVGLLFLWFVVLAHHRS